jgi:hypothetical protein
MKNENYKKESHSLLLNRERVVTDYCRARRRISNQNPKRGTKLWPLLALFAFYPSLINTPIGIYIRISIFTTISIDV